MARDDRRADGFWEMYKIGGADMALRYAEMLRTGSPGDTPASDDSFRIHEVTIYEHGVDPPRDPHRRSVVRFRQSRTRYIWFDLHFLNPRESFDAEYQVVAHYRHADGTLLGTLTGSGKALSTWRTCCYTGGWGWAAAGNWSVGAYRLEITLDHTQQASAAFEIYEDIPTRSRKPRVAVARVPPTPQRTVTTDPVLLMVEEIIGAASPAAAAALADRYASRITSQCLLETTGAEMKARGTTRRFHALTRLSEYYGARLRNTLIAGVGSPEPLPELLVVANGDTADADTDDLRPDSFQAWTRILNRWAAPTHPRRRTGLSDVDRTALVHSIDRRLVSALQEIANPSSAETTLATLQEIRRDCDELLSAPASEATDTESLAVQLRKTDALKYVADIEARIGRTAMAGRHYHEAATEYARLGRRMSQVRCLVDRAMLDLDTDFDAAIRALRGVLADVPPRSMAAAEVLASLAEACLTRNEHHEALRYAGRAEDSLKDAGVPHAPSGAQTATLLTRMLLSDQPAGTDSDRFRDGQSAGALYRRIYRVFAEVCRRQGRFAEADTYLRRIEDAEGTIRDGSQTNVDFSRTMMQNLDAILKKLDGR